MHDFNWQDGFTGGRFFWIEWHVWKAVGWLGAFRTVYDGENKF